MPRRPPPAGEVLTAEGRAAGGARVRSLKARARSRRSRRWRRTSTRRRSSRRCAQASRRARIRWSRRRHRGSWRISLDQRGETAEAASLRASLGLLSHTFVIGPFGEGRASLNTAFPPETEAAAPELGARRYPGKTHEVGWRVGRRGDARRRPLPGRPAASRRPGGRLRRDVRAQRTRSRRRRCASGRPGRSRSGSTARPCSRTTSSARRRWIRTRSASASGAAGTGS